MFTIAREYIAQNGGKLVSLFPSRGTGKTLQLTSEAAEDATKLPIYQIPNAQGRYSPLFSGHGAVLLENGSVYDPTFSMTFRTVDEFRNYFVGNANVFVMK